MKPTLPTVILGAAAGLAIAGAAHSQPADTGNANWNGVYFGLNAGWNGYNSPADASTAHLNQLTGVNNGTSTVTVPATTFNTARIENSKSDGTWGGQVGLNRQSGPFVFGVEGDINALYGRQSQASSYAIPATGLTTSSSESVRRFTDPNWMASLRGRAGWATGPLLLYGTGGIAWANVRQGVDYAYAPTVTGGVAAANPGTTFGPYFNGSSREATLTGWTLGGGAEWALSHGVSVGAEYRHSDFGHRTYFQGQNSADSTFQATRIGFTDDSVLAKVNFRFGGGGMF